MRLVRVGLAAPRAQSRGLALPVPVVRGAAPAPGTARTAEVTVSRPG